MDDPIRVPLCMQVNTAIGYTDRQAATRLECCNFCGLQPGCGDFVFQPSTGLCVLLPGASEVVKIPNSQVVSGAVSVALLRPEALEHGDCVFTPGALTTP